MEPIGQTLRQAREQKGLTLAQVKASLRIHGAYLEALEAEEYDQLPPAAYARAFLKEYAIFLGLDPEPLLSALNAARPEPENPNSRMGWTAAPPMPHRWGELLVPAVFIGLLAFFVLGAWYVYQFQAGKEEAGRAVVAAKMAEQRRKAAPTRRVAVAPVKPPLAAKAPAGDLPQAIKAPAGNLPQVANAPAGNMPQTANAPAGNLTMESALPANPGVAVTAAADKACWISIHGDGKLLYQGMMRAGETRSWNAAQAVALHAGNAGGLRLTVNGQDLGVLGRPGQVVQRTFQAGAVMQTVPPPVPANTSRQ